MEGKEGGGVGVERGGVGKALIKKRLRKERCEGLERGKG
jgi:hypothetical protein